MTIIRVLQPTSICQQSTWPCCQPLIIHCARAIIERSISLYKWNKLKLVREDGAEVLEVTAVAAAADFWTYPARRRPGWLVVTRQQDHPPGISLAVHGQGRSHQCRYGTSSN